MDPLLQFYVSGHSFMEADSIHGNIEREIKRRLTPKTNIHTPDDANEVIWHATAQGYEVKEKTAEDVMDWKNVHSHLMGKRGVPSMMKVRAMSFTQVCGSKHMRTANNIAMFLLQFTFMYMTCRIDECEVSSILFCN